MKTYLYDYFFSLKKMINKMSLNYFSYLILLLPLISLNDNNIKINEDGVEVRTYYQMLEKRKEYIENQEFTYDLFNEYIDLIFIKNKKTVISQSILETNWFNSNIFIENNNLFGMKEPRVRKTTAIGTNRGHAIYKHWTCSVIDYKLWYLFVSKNRTYNNYYDFLTYIGYAEDGDYINKLKSIKIILNNKENLLAYEN